MNTKPMECFGETPEKSCQGCPYRLDCAQESSWNQLLEEDKKALEKHGLSPYANTSLYYRDLSDDYIPDNAHDFNDIEPTIDELLLDFCLAKLGYLIDDDIQYLEIAKEAIRIYNTENHPNSVYIGSATHSLPGATYFALFHNGDRSYGLTRFWEIYHNLKAGKDPLVQSQGQTLGDLLRTHGGIF